MTDEELKELTEIQVARFMALRKDLKGSMRAAFIADWGEEEVKKYEEITDRLIELKKLETKHAVGEEGKFLDISEINVEGW